uniref:Putative secreted protein n=1 Tax=Anopheles darlingi TaxID=43151 RepID=A0A2M4D119_ANODA
MRLLLLLLRDRLLVVLLLLLLLMLRLLLLLLRSKLLTYRLLPLRWMCLVLDGVGWRWPGNTLQTGAARLLTFLLLQGGQHGRFGQARWLRR